MPYLRLIALPCRLSRGAFSDERVFEIAVPGQQAPHIGAASRHYCWNEQDEPLNVNEPPPGHFIDGKVAARLLRVEGDCALVSIPDGEVVTVDKTQVLPRPPEPARDVSLQP